MKIYKFIGFIALLGWSAVSCNDWQIGRAHV